MSLNFILSHLEIFVFAHILPRPPLMSQRRVWNPSPYCLVACLHHQSPLSSLYFKPSVSSPLVPSSVLSKLLVFLILKTAFPDSYLILKQREYNPGGKLNWPQMPVSYYLPRPSIPPPNIQLESYFWIFLPSNCIWI